MLFERNDNTFDSGSLDVICMLHDVNTDRYHAAFFEEHPMPGGYEANKDLSFVRLKSKMHHTGGADTIEEALTHVEDLKSKIHVPEKNVWLEPKKWDGELGITWVVPKW
jgi:hypothetical protein